MDTILVINSGSSTIKFALFTIVNEDLILNYQGIVDHVTTRPIFEARSATNEMETISEAVPVASNANYNEQAVRHILKWITTKGLHLVAIGHRIVHSGPDYSAPVILNDVVMRKLASYSEMMPLHQMFNINGVKILREILPNTVQVACFDTGFHSTCNPISQIYALPKKFRDAGIKRYGFHGLSYEYIASKLPECTSAEQAQGKFVIAHLGNGSTMCAIKKQQSVATSIGMTGIGGLPMGTRCDSIDPGAVIYMLNTYNLKNAELLNILYRESGLLGLSGFSSDMRELLASKKPEAKLAIDVFVHHIATFTGMLTAELQGIDGFVFTGGIGENAALIRKMVCDHLGWLGFEIDDNLNNTKISVAKKISNQKSKVEIFVIPTNEEIIIAKHTYNLAAFSDTNKPLITC
jgi:acetate kinase